MHEQTPARHIRVTLRYVEILDSKDFDTIGEFRFRFRVGVPERGEVQETRIPEEPGKHLAISEHPAMNRVTLNQVLFEGELEPTDSLVVAAEGEEVDRLSANDPLTPYRRVFDGPVVDAVGDHGPWDEGSPEGADPEQLGDWRIAYSIEAVGAPAVAAEGSAGADEVGPEL